VTENGGVFADSRDAVLLEHDVGVADSGIFHIDEELVGADGVEDYGLEDEGCIGFRDDEGGG